MAKIKMLRNLFMVATAAKPAYGYGFHLEKKVVSRRHSALNKVVSTRNKANKKAASASTTTPERGLLQPQPISRVAVHLQQDLQGTAVEQAQGDKSHRQLLETEVEEPEEARDVGARGPATGLLFLEQKNQQEEQQEDQTLSSSTSVEEVASADQQVREHAVEEQGALSSALESRATAGIGTRPAPGERPVPGGASDGKSPESPVKSPICIVLIIAAGILLLCVIAFIVYAVLNVADDEEEKALMKQKEYDLLVTKTEAFSFIKAAGCQPVDKPLGNADVIEQGLVTRAGFSPQAAVTITKAVTSPYMSDDAAVTTSDFDGPDLTVFRVLGFSKDDMESPSLLRGWVAQNILAKARAPSLTAELISRGDVEERMILRGHCEQALLQIGFASAFAAVAADYSVPEASAMVGLGDDGGHGTGSMFAISSLTSLRDEATPKLTQPALQQMVTDSDGNIGLGANQLVLQRLGFAFSEDNAVFMPEFSDSVQNAMLFPQWVRKQGVWYMKQQLGVTNDLRIEGAAPPDLENCLVVNGFSRPFAHRCAYALAQDVPVNQRTRMPESIADISVADREILQMRGVLPNSGLRIVTLKAEGAGPATPAKKTTAQPTAGANNPLASMRTPMAATLNAEDTSFAMEHQPLLDRARFAGDGNTRRDAGFVLCLRGWLRREMGTPSGNKFLDGSTGGGPVASDKAMATIAAEAKETSSSKKNLGGSGAAAALQEQCGLSVDLAEALVEAAGGSATSSELIPKSIEELHDADLNAIWRMGCLPAQRLNNFFAQTLVDNVARVCAVLTAGNKSGYEELCGKPIACANPVEDKQRIKDFFKKQGFSPAYAVRLTKAATTSCDPLPLVMPTKAGDYYVQLGLGLMPPPRIVDAPDKRELIERVAGFVKRCWQEYHLGQRAPGAAGTTLTLPSFGETEWALLRSGFSPAFAAKAAAAMASTSGDSRATLNELLHDLPQSDRETIKEHGLTAVLADASSSGGGSRAAEERVRKALSGFVQYKLEELASVDEVPEADPAVVGSISAKNQGTTVAIGMSTTSTTGGAPNASTSGGASAEVIKSVYGGVGRSVAQSQVLSIIAHELEKDYGECHPSEHKESTQAVLQGSCGLSKEFSGKAADAIVVSAQRKSASVVAASVDEDIVEDKEKGEVIKSFRSQAGNQSAGGVGGGQGSYMKEASEKDKKTLAQLGFDLDAMQEGAENRTGTAASTGAQSEHQAVMSQILSRGKVGGSITGAVGGKSGSSGAAASATSNAKLGLDDFEAWADNRASQKQQSEMRAEKSKMFDVVKSTASATSSSSKKESNAASLSGANTSGADTGAGTSSSRGNKIMSAATGKFVVPGGNSQGPPSAYFPSGNLASKNKTGAATASGNKSGKNTAAAAGASSKKQAGGGVDATLNAPGQTTTSFQMRGSSARKTEGQ